MVRRNCLNAKLNIGQVRKVTMDRDSGQWQKLQRAWLEVGRSPAGHTPLEAPPTVSYSRDTECRTVAFAPGTGCKFLFIPFFLIESGSQTFRQEIIYVSIFQRHFIVWGRERGKGRSQYKNKSVSRWIFFFFFWRLKSVYCSSRPFSPSSFMMLLRCPFQHNIFKWSKPWGSSWCLAVMKYI